VSSSSSFAASLPVPFSMCVLSPCVRVSLCVCVVVHVFSVSVFGRVCSPVPIAVNIYRNRHRHKPTQTHQTHSQQYGHTYFHGHTDSHTDMQIHQHAHPEIKSFRCCLEVVRGAGRLRFRWGEPSRSFSSNSSTAYTNKHKELQTRVTYPSPGACIDMIDERRIGSHIRGKTGLGHFVSASSGWGEPSS
jgi:hypothetical protein